MFPRDLASRSIANALLIQIDLQEMHAVIFRVTLRMCRSALRHFYVAMVSMMLIHLSVIAGMGWVCWEVYVVLRVYSFAELPIMHNHIGLEQKTENISDIKPSLPFLVKRIKLKYISMQLQAVCGASLQSRLPRGAHVPLQTEIHKERIPNILGIL